MTGDDRDLFVDTLKNRLDAIGSQGRRVTMWWRDDDAIEPTAQIDALINRSADQNVPIGLAVIPSGAGAALAARLDSAPLVEVLQHGWQHKNHQPKGSKAAELGDARPQEDVFAELRDGFARLTNLFGTRFKAVLVPPWNRISPGIAENRSEVGLTGLSTFGACDAIHQVNCHLDPISWKTTRGFVGWPRAAHLVAEELDRRIAGSDEPFGLLTHHLVHDDALWAFVDAFLEVAAGHPATDWPDMRRLFALA